MPGNLTKYLQSKFQEACPTGCQIRSVAGKAQRCHLGEKREPGALEAAGVVVRKSFLEH